MITVGHKCNYLTVIEKQKKDGSDSLYYLCRCVCGKERLVADNVIRYSHIQDCGCGQFQLNKQKEEFIGKKFNLLTVVDCFRKSYQNHNRIFAKCKCDCGNEIDVCVTDLKNNHAKSCGCLRKFNFERDYKDKIYHNIRIVDMVDATKKIIKCQCYCGEYFNVALIDILKKTRYVISCPKCNHKPTPKYNISKKQELSDGELKFVFYGMKTRCYSPNRADKKWYYDKKISICKEWLNDVNSFVSWAKANGYKKGLTIDRIDPNKGYSPENCRWTTMEVQNNNHKNIQKYGYNGEYLSLAQISRRVGINYRTLLSRIKRGMSIENALSTPTK